MRGAVSRRGLLTTECRVLGQTKSVPAIQIGHGVRQLLGALSTGFIRSSRCKRRNSDGRTGAGLDCTFETRRLVRDEPATRRAMVSETLARTAELQRHPFGLGSPISNPRACPCPANSPFPGAYHRLCIFCSIPITLHPWQTGPPRGEPRARLNRGSHQIATAVVDESLRAGTSRPGERGDALPL